MALSDIALCSRALLKIGAQPVASLEEGSAEAEVAANLYPAVRDGLLASFPWSFATRQATLPRLAVAPLADWNNAFQLPADLLRVLSAGSPYLGSGLAYHVLGDQLHCNAEQVTLSYIRRPDESHFPPHFAEGLVARGVRRRGLSSRTPLLPTEVMRQPPPPTHRREVYVLHTRQPQPFLDLFARAMHARSGARHAWYTGGRSAAGAELSRCRRANAARKCGAWHGPPHTHSTRRHVAPHLVHKLVP